jgi:hypothetical protein
MPHPKHELNPISLNMQKDIVPLETSAKNRHSKANVQKVGSR